MSSTWLKRIACDAASAIAATIFATNAMAADPGGLAGKAGAATGKLQRLAISPTGARILIELTGDADDRASIERAHRDPIARRRLVVIQDEVLRRYTGSDESKHRRWAIRRLRSVPYLAMSVSLDELNALAADPRVRAIHEDELHAPSLSRSVPLSGAKAAQAAGADGADTIIAVLDTGVDGRHEFVAGRVVEEACYSTTIIGTSSSLCPSGRDEQVGKLAGSNCSSSIAGCSHGTHVAGIAAGSRRSGQPSVGVAPRAQIFSVQVFSRFDSASTCGGVGPCALAFTSDILAGLEQVHDRMKSLQSQLVAVNMSLGGGRYGTACDTSPLKVVIDRLRDAGVATVVAAGNESYVDAVASPACISSAVTVSAITDAGEVSSFSNIGPQVDLLAPGSRIVSSVPFGGYAQYDGTSMAAPHVAGAFAALKSRAPWASVDEIQHQLATTGTSVTDGRTNGSLVRPAIQTDAALAALRLNEPSLLVLPGADFVVSGEVGGKLKPLSRTYRVINTTKKTLTWEAQVRTLWVQASPKSGVLSPGATANVKITLGTGIPTLQSGLYSRRFELADIADPNGKAERSMRIELNAPFCHDDFQKAPLIEGLKGRTRGMNVRADKQPGEPAHAGNDGGRSVWCRWQAPATRSMRFETLDSSFDTLLAVYTGQNIGTLRTVASSDDVGLAGRSRVEFRAEAGRTYYIAIDGKRPARGATAAGEVVLKWAPPCRECR